MAEPGGLRLWLLFWIIMIPMFYVIKKVSGLIILLLCGFWMGCLMAMGIFSWLLGAMIVFWEISPIVALILFIIIVSIIGIQIPIFFLLTRLIYEKTHLPIGILGCLIYALVEYWMPLPFHIQFGLGFALTPLLIQISDLMGMWGVSLFIVLVNGLLFTLLENLYDKKSRQVFVLAIAIFIIIGFQVLYGLFCLSKYKPDLGDSSIDVAMIQPVSPLKIMNADHETKLQVAENIFRLSKQAIADKDKKPDLLIFPEGAAPFAYLTPTFNPEFTEVIKDLQKEMPVPLLVQDVEFVKIKETGKIGYYSHISLIGDDGTYLSGYRKNILMPFTEYLPGEKMFPFLKKLFHQTRSVLKGRKMTLIDGPNGKFVPLICYEIIFEDFVRKFVKQDESVKYIINLTNDRWYGPKQQPQQHLSYAVFRAVENRMPVVRSTNSGISAIIDSCGIIRPEYKTAVIDQTFLRGKIYFHSHKTIYSQLGDIIPKVILTPLFLIFIFSVYILKRHRKPLK